MGDSYDNVLAETINGLYKAEVIYRQPLWRRREDVEWATLKWGDWFSNRGLLGPLGYVTPAEAETHYYPQIPEGVYHTNEPPGIPGRFTSAEETF